MPAEEKTVYLGQHLDLSTLKEEQREGGINNGYLLNSTPAYPRPELHVSHVSHSTDLQGLQGVSDKGGFEAPSNEHERPKQLKVVWFSLTVSPEELREAEKRTLRVVHPGGREEEFTPQAGDPEEDLAAAVGGLSLTDEGVLQKFAKSPAFRSSSRYGSFRFTFDLKKILKKYRKQICRGWPPVLRAYRTVLYKQEVMYVVLVHSPINNRRFYMFPRLKRRSICEFRPKKQPPFVWRPESMSDAYRSELNVINGELSITDAGGPHYFVWDHVALALHVGDKKLKFEEQELRGSLSFCEEDYPSVKPHTQFQTFEEAQAEVQKLWPHHHLKKFSQSPFHVTE